MADLKKAGFRESMPTLKATDLQGAKFTVVTIESAEIVPGDGRKNSRQQLVLLKFSEWPDRNYYPNSTGIGALMKRLGSETNNWTRKQVPLKVTPTQNPETKEEVDALHVAPVSEWDSLLEEYAGLQSGNSSGKKTRGRR